MERASFEIEESIELLQRTPSVLDAWLRGLSDAWVYADEGPETFSPFEIVGHLICGERSDWIQRARHILAGRDEPFEPFDRFAQRTEFAGRALVELLDTFAELRAANLATLKGFELTPRQLAARGRHPALGEVRLDQLLATWVVHDQGHLAQLARVLAKRYAAHVGPWREYLPVLADRPRS